MNGYYLFLISVLILALMALGCHGVRSERLVYTYSEPTDNGGNGETNTTVNPGGLLEVAVKAIAEVTRVITSAVVRIETGRTHKVLKYSRLGMFSKDFEWLKSADLNVETPEDGDSKITLEVRSMSAEEEEEVEEPADGE